MTCTVQRNGFNQLAVKGRMPVRRGVTVRYMPNRVLVVGPMRFVMPDHREMAKLFMSGGSASVSMTVSGPCQPSPINTASDMPARAMPYLHKFKPPQRVELRVRGGEATRQAFSCCPGSEGVKAAAKI